MPKRSSTPSAAAVLGEPIEVSPLSAGVANDRTRCRSRARHTRRACMCPSNWANDVHVCHPVDARCRRARSRQTCSATGTGEPPLRSKKSAAARADEQAHRIASHWLDAGQREKAAGYFARSAARRLSTRQFEASAAEATRSLELIELSKLAVSDALSLLRTLAAAVTRTRVSPATPALLERLVAHIDSTGNTEEQALIRIEAARILGAIGEIDPALELLSAVHERSVNTPSIAQQARLVEADLYFRKGDFHRCMLVLEDARSRGLPESKTSAC
ncbi:MAG: hypothetical protein U0165_08890 [Polyangiaceae bacterium]